MTPGPMVFRVPMSSRGGPSKLHRVSLDFGRKNSQKKFFFFLFGDHLILAGKTNKILVKTFFFWRSLDFGRKNSRNFGDDYFFGDRLILAGKTNEILVNFFFF